MKRVLAAAALIALAACSESPTQLPTTTQPQFTTVIGTGGIWHFRAVVTYAFSGSAQLGDVVEGTYKFTINSDDAFAGDPCIADRSLATELTYTVNGAPTTVAGQGWGVSYMDCYYNVNGPRLQMNVSLPSGYYALDFYSPDVTKDTPLVPPALQEPPDGQWYSMFWMFDNQGNNFRAKFTAVWADPVSKVDCMKDGWKNFQFKNQGQCVRFIETGKDSR